MAIVKPLHRISVGENARPMIELVKVFVKQLYRRDVILLTLSLRAHRLSFFNGFPTLLKFGSARRSPEGMIIAYCNAPVTHAALWVVDGNFSENLFSIFILERMEPSDCEIELLLNLCGAGNWKINTPEFY